MITRSMTIRPRGGNYLGRPSLNTPVSLIQQAFDALMYSGPPGANSPTITQGAQTYPNPNYDPRAPIVPPFSYLVYSRDTNAWDVPGARNLPGWSNPSGGGAANTALGLFGQALYPGAPITWGWALLGALLLWWLLKR